MGEVRCVDWILVLNQLSQLVQNFIGVVLPPVIDLLNRKVASSVWRFIISVGICILVAAIINYPKFMDGDWTQFATKFSLIFTEAQIIYQLYWKKSSVRSKLIGE